MAAPAIPAVPEAKTALEVARDRAEAEAKAQNDKREGKGTRIKVGSTRGKNPQVISFEAFDEAQPATLPTTITEFTELTKTPDEKTLVEYLVEGFNAISYTAASDPIAEFVNYAWPEDLQRQFRLVVRNYSTATKVSIEDAVNLIRPGIDASFQASLKKS